MRQSLKNLLLCSISLSIYPSCGLEDDSESQFVQTSLNGAGAREETLGPSHEQPPTRFISSPGEMRPRVDGLGMVLGAIVIDRSGSMTAPRDMTTRCDAAVTQAVADLAYLFENCSVQRVSIRTFSGVAPVQSEGYLDRTAAEKFIDDHIRGTPCSGLTPLADAMCDAAIELNAQSLPGDIPATVVVETDGGENSSMGNCKGNPGDFDTSGTWAFNVKQRVDTLWENGLAHVSFSVNHYKNNLLTFARSDSSAAAAPLCSDTVSCDSKLFATLANQTGGAYRQIKDDDPAYPCPSPSACPAPDSINVGNHFSFSATNTNSATAHTVNHSVFLLAGDTITMGTCGVPGSSGVGDTYLRVFNSSGGLMAINDDSCGLLSLLAFTAPADGTYLIRAGCFSTGTCSGTVSYVIQSAFTYVATITNNATVNTTNHNVYLRPGQQIRVGTCGVPFANGNGDTFLRFRNPSGLEVAFNDDSCGLLSNIVYNNLAGTTGLHQIRAGCFSTASCAGTVGYFIEEAPPPPVIIIR